MKKTDMVYVVSFPSSYAEGQIITTLWDRKPTDPKYTIHEEIPVTYDVPPREVQVKAAVEALEAEKQQVTAEAHARKVEITARIQALLAIEQVA